MSTKTKIPNKQIESLSRAAQQAGIVLMTAAVTLGMLELPDKANRIVIPNQPALAFAENNSEDNLNNAVRREREETAPHYISYNVSQRTPGRTGRA